MRITVITFLCLWLANNMFAQERQILPDAMKQYTVVTEPLTLPKGYLRVGEAISYTLISGKEFDKNGKRSFFPESSNYWNTEVSLQTYLRYGITNRLQVSLWSNYCFLQKQLGMMNYSPTNDSIIDYSSILKGNGLKNFQLDLQFQIIPQTEDRLSSLTGMVKVLIPAGPKYPRNVKDANHYDLPTASLSYAASVYLTYKKIRYPFSYRLIAGYIHNFPGKVIVGTMNFEKIPYRNGDSFMGSASFNIHLNEWIALTNEVNVFTFGPTTFDGREYSSHYSLDYVGHIVFHIKRFRVSEGIDVPIMGKKISTDPTYYITFGYLF